MTPLNRILNELVGFEYSQSFRKYWDLVALMQQRLETFILLTGILKKFVTKDTELMNHIKEVETVLLETNEKMISGMNRTLDKKEESYKRYDLGENMEEIYKLLESTNKLVLSLQNSYNEAYHCFIELWLVVDEEVKMPEFPILPVMEHIRFMDPEEHDKLKVRRIKIKNKRK
ncbi:MAG: hypothetical protein A7315_15255 [Candidatus Altiarchaeales archaeon WOR_SM1_79]|nr:MAG: hypothetical protein A7315_15255 [Candidatus Altiarchaeales archaeon WOR_SM1_79]